MKEKLKSRLQRMYVTGAALLLLMLSMGSTVFACEYYYDANEGIGIEVHAPKDVMVTKSSAGTIEGDKVTVSGGSLWATWKDGVLFRANYDHSTKTHRCSATNDHFTTIRSQWMPAGSTARTDWLEQTVSNNKVWAATMD